MRHENIIVGYFLVESRPGKGWCYLHKQNSSRGKDFLTWRGRGKEHLKRNWRKYTPASSMMYWIADVLTYRNWLGAVTPTYAIKSTRRSKGSTLRLLRGGIAPSPSRCSSSKTWSAARWPKARRRSDLNTSWKTGNKIPLLTGSNTPLITGEAEGVYAEGILRNRISRK